MDNILPLRYTCYMATAERPLRKDAERNRKRILDAAAELFTERGLGVTLNDIAHHADVGVGTVYRRFPDKEQLIDALFEDRLVKFVALAEESLADPDPWNGFVSFLERGFELQARDKALKQLLFATPQGCARVESVREQVLPLAEGLVRRAQKAGALRRDAAAGDIAVIQWMLGAIVDHAGATSPELWRRYLELILAALRADPGPPQRLAVPALGPEQLDQVLGSEAMTAGGRGLGAGRAR